MVYYSKTPLDEVRVELVQGEVTNPPLQTTFTSNGHYHFSFVVPGSYWVKAYAPNPEYIGWKANSIEVAYDDITRDIYLPKLMTLLSPGDGADVASLHPTLTWEANPEAAYYWVQVNVMDTWELVEFEESVSTEHTISALLSPGVEYAWQIDAYDSQHRHVGTTDATYRFTAFENYILLIEAEFEVFGDGIAEWTSEVAHSGSYSVKLLIPEDSWVAVKVPYGKILSTLSPPSSYVSYTTARPRFVLYLDKTGDGEVDSLLLSDYLDNGVGEWTIETGGLRWGWTEATYPPTQYGELWQPYENWQTLYDDTVVLYLGVVLEYWAVEPDGIGKPLYVDDIVINGIAYDLEPVEGLPPEDLPPTCIIKLQKGGVEINEVDVGEFFDIHAGDSSDDTKQVRFSSDDVQDGSPTGKWTEWYDWDVSSGDWNADTKIKRWAFATPGYKEVWAEVEYDVGQTATCHANILANLPESGLVVITSPLVITPIKDIYYVGDSLNAEFSITNIGDLPITLDVLTVGGRLNGIIPAEGAPDFTHQSVTLQPDESYQYEGALTLTQSGNYRFFVAYYIEDPTADEKSLLDENNWNTCVKLGEGLTNANRVKNIIALEHPDTVSELRDRINRELRREVTFPPYLLDADSFTSAIATLWMDFTSWATRTHLNNLYDEFYKTGIDYECLRVTALINARKALDRGDVPSAEKYLEQSYTYNKLSYMSFTATFEVYDAALDAGEILAEGIKKGCEASRRIVTLALKITNPVAAKTADYVFLAVDYAVDYMLVDEEEATKNAIVKIAVMLTFDEIKFVDLGGRTISEFTRDRIGEVTFPILQNIFKSEVHFEYLASKIYTRIIEEIGVEIEESVAEDLAKRIWNMLEEGVDLERAEVKSPVALQVYDSQGRITGLLNRETRHEISRSVYYNGAVTIFFPSATYCYEVVGRDEGTYGLEITSLKAGTLTVFTTTDIPITPVAIHQYVVDWDALSRGEEGVTVQIDSNGDGVFERTITADNKLTRDEFILQTATTIDFDPDTLNLRSKEKWVTVYIELPEGYNVGQIDVSSIRLNSIVSALTKPTEIGDYDGDGIPDLMVKFDGASVIALFAGKTVPGNYVIEITGTWAGTSFRGKDTIRIISPP